MTSPARSQQWVKLSSRIPPKRMNGLAVWTWDGKKVREDTYGPIYKEGVYVTTGFHMGDCFPITHWMPRLVPKPPVDTAENLHIKQAAEVKFLKAQGWTLQAIQRAYPDAQYCTLRRTFAGLRNKAVAPVAP